MLIIPFRYSELVEHTQNVEEILLPVTLLVETLESRIIVVLRLSSTLQVDFLFLLHP